MKTSIKKAIKTKCIYTLAILLGIVLFTSCRGDSNNPANNFADNGITLSKNAIKLISEINSNETNKSYDKEFIKIMVDPSPETYLMKTDTSKRIYGIQFLYMNNAFKGLEKIFIAYQLQLDSKISLSNSNLSEKMLSACNALDSLAIGAELQAKNKILKKNLSTGKYRIEGSVFQITDIYAEVWDEMTKNYLSAQYQAQKEYINGIKSIPVGAFNSEKIKTIIEEPYSNNAVLANLYKLKLIKDNQEKLAAFETRINNISESFRVLLQIQGELIKHDQNKVKIKELNSALETLLANQ